MHGQKTAAAARNNATSTMRPPRARLPRGPSRAPEVAPRTGPFDILKNKHVLVLADEQNLSIGARDLGLSVCWSRLGQSIDHEATISDRHVFLAEPAGNDRASREFWEMGWLPHAKEDRVVRTHRGFERKSNIDHHLAFLGGYLLCEVRPEVLVVASGDGDLVEDLSESARLARPGIKVVTLSLAGSTSSRLDARRTHRVDANIELGLDCLLSYIPRIAVAAARKQVAS